MDPISHLAITAALVSRQPKTLLAGLGPDLPWYLCYPLWMLHKRGIRAALRSGDWPMPPRWLAEIDYASHSLLFLGLLCVACLKRENRRLAAAWLLHLLLDIPTHSRERMAPRPFWPFSHWAYDGISWADHIAHLVALLYTRRNGAPPY